MGVVVAIIIVGLILFFVFFKKEKTILLPSAYQDHKEIIEVILIKREKLWVLSFNLN